MKTGLAALGFLIALFAAVLASFRSQVDSANESIQSEQQSRSRFEQEQTRILTSMRDGLLRLEGRQETLALQSHEDRRLRDRIAALENEISRSERASRLTLDEIEGLRRALSRDTEALMRDVLQPSVQVNGKGGVGGGTILHSGAKEGTYVVTAFHVIQKVVSKNEGVETREPVEVRIYTASGALAETVESDLIAYQEKKDIALLKLKSTKVYANVAHLAPREKLSTVNVFTPIYAVGCPLGHDPLPSLGEISTLNKEVNGEKFWMMNAPTIFGNSGGGVFNRETHELIGFSAMICTFDNFVSTPVPHLGILVSLSTLYDWLDEEFYQYVYNPAFTPERCDALKVERTKSKSTAAKLKVEY